MTQDVCEFDAICLLLGYTGQISLGQAAFYGIGAYVSAILSSRFGVSPWLAMVIAAAASGAFAYLIGIPILRLRGNYLAMATLGLGIIMYIIFRELDVLTNGPTGISGIPYLSIGGFAFDSDRKYYYLVTISLFDSKYKSGDGIERNTRFNSNFVVNLLGGKEWTIRKKNILGVNLKVSVTGGEYYVPIDLDESKLQHREVLDDSQAYFPRLPAFCYLDFTLTYRTNHKKFSGIWALQIKNLLNQKPPTGYIYNDFNQSVEKSISIGILPLISYKIEF